MGLGLFAATSVSVALLASKPAVEAKAATDETLIYIDISGTDTWASWGGYTVKVKLWNGSEGTGDAWAWDHDKTPEEGGIGTETIKGKTYYTFSREYYLPANYTGGYVYAYEPSETTKHHSASFSFADATTGQNLLVVTGGSESKSPAVAWDTLEVGTKYTVSKLGVYDGVVDTGKTKKDLGSDNVVSGETYAIPGAQYVAGYVFGGWYTDTTCETSYTASVITADRTIYAKYTTHSAWSGVVYVDLASSGWAEADANYAIYFMNKTTYVSEVGGWSSYITGTEAGHHKVTVDYSLSFEPQQMIVVRYDSEYLEATWSTDPWCDQVEEHKASKWGQTYDIDQISAYVTIGEYESGEGKNKNTWKVGCATVNSSSASWGVLENLSNVKENGDNYVEYYNYVTLADNDKFKVVYNGTWYGNYTCHKSLKDNFGTDGDNITCTKGGLYSFYFSTNTNSVYITTPTLAAADEWGAYFLSVVVCDATGATEPTGWSEAASSYATLSDDVKDIIYAATADESGTYYEHAVKRYDTAVKNHPSLTRFITDHEGHQRLVEHGGHSIFGIDGIVSGNNITLIAIVSIIAVASISAVMIFVVVKRRKHN